MPFASAMNFRDLGGKRAQGATRTRAGLLFRTGNLANLDDRTAGLLVERLGLKVYCDLRVAREITRDGPPSALIHAGVTWHKLPVDSFDPSFNHTHPEVPHWVDLYIRVFAQHRATFVALLRAAAEAPGPLVFGCTAGKDRTGIGAAVLLGCLGVEEEEILADYAQTTTDILPHAERFARHWAKPGRSREEFVMHYLTASRDILAGFLAEVTRRFGSMEAALAEAGITAEMLEVLRRRYLTEEPARSG